MYSPPPMSFLCCIANNSFLSILFAIFFFYHSMANDLTIVIINKLFTLCPRCIRILFHNDCNHLKILILI